MPLRQVVVTDPQPQRPLELRRVIFTTDGIETVWHVVAKDGSVRDERVEVTTALAAMIKGRTGVQLIFDQIRDDTINRIPQ